MNLDNKQIAGCMITATAVMEVLKKNRLIDDNQQMEVIAALSVYFQEVYKERLTAMTQAAEPQRPVNIDTPTQFANPSSWLGEQK